jgi:iron complex transport system substrate-binding protein
LLVPPIYTDAADTDGADTDGADDPAVSVERLITEGEALSTVTRHAEGFRAYRHGELTLVEVTRPWQGAGPQDSFRYVLYPRGEAEPAVAGADATVGVPIDSIVTMSTTFLPHLDILGRLESLVAVDSVAYAYNPEVHRMASAGELMEVGAGRNVDIERLIALDPDLIMVNSFGGDRDARPVLEEAGLPVVVSGDWVENRPLGRAEWLLFTSLFYEDLDEARDRVREVEAAYRDLAERVAEELGAGDEERPTVLVNAPYQGTWTVPGGESYMARYIRDAGGAYVWSDSDRTGSLFLDIESVYAEAGDADIWINPGVWESLAQGAAEDERFTNFAAFRREKVYNNNRRMGPGGGNDYFESGAVNPHLILQDLVSIFHPDLLPGYERHYYRKLQ